MFQVFMSRVREVVASAGRFIRGQRPGRPSKRPPTDAGAYVSRILSDAILLNEIPSPTEHESSRTEFILQRLAELGYPSSQRDDLGNVTAVIPAHEATDEHVLLFAGLRCDDYSPLESVARLTPDRLEGRGIAESSVPSASLLVLAEYLARNEIQYERNILFLFTAHDPADMDSPALDAFLERWKGKVCCAAFLRGLGLGSVGDRPLGTCKISVGIRTEEHDLIGGAHAPSAISALADVASRLGGIHWDDENSTFLNIARIEAGVGFGWFASTGIMEIEVFSPDAAALEVAKNAVVATIKGATPESGAVVDVSLKAYLPPGNQGLNSALSGIVTNIHEKLRIKSRPALFPTAAALLTSRGIPAVTLGMATGRKSGGEEYIEISTLEPGFRQILRFTEACAARRREGTA